MENQIKINKAGTGPAIVSVPQYLIWFMKDFDFSTLSSFSTGNCDNNDYALFCS